MRLSEWVLAAYFSYVTALSLIIAVSPDIRIRTIVVNGVLLCLYGILLGSSRFRNRLVVQHLRNLSTPVQISPKAPIENSPAEY